MKWGFIAPVLIFLIAFNVFPLLYNVVLGFSNSRLTSTEYELIGGNNYARVFEKEQYAAAIRTTATFVFFAVLAELVLGFLLALSLHKHFRGKSLALGLILVPMMLAPMVMGMFWNLIFDGNYGILNQVLAGIGLGEPQWTTDNALKLLSILIVDIWMWTPFMMLIALAGLNAIPRHLYEAAEIDRASRWMVFRRITLPMCTPLLILAALLRCTDALKQFDIVMAITGPNDGETQTVSALLFQDIFNNAKVGLGSAYACVILVIVIAVATIFTRYLDWLERKQGRAA